MRICAVLAAGLFALILGSDHVMAAEPPTANVAPAAAFTSITFSDSGGFTGRGTGKWLSIDGNGKVRVRKSNGPASDGQLDKEQLAELAQNVAAVDWPNVNTTYPSPGADMIQNDLVVVIDGKTHDVHAVAQAVKLPKPVQALFARLTKLYQQFAAVDK